MSKSWTSKCINPFKKENHSVYKNLCKLPHNFREQYPDVPPDAVICLKCKMSFHKNKDDTSNLDFKKLKLENCDDAYHKAGVETLNQIIDKFKKSKDKSERLALLTLAPKFWTHKELMKYFSASDREVRAAKTLTKEKGILSFPEKKKGKTLSSETESLVKDFYQRDEMSRLMPGIKDYVSVKQDNGKRVHVQKRLLLCNLNELYAEFKKEFKDTQISFSMFAKLRPPHCVLAGSSGTHTVCVCVHHENIKLMINAMNIDYLTKDTEYHLTDYHDCIKFIVCANSTDACFLGECKVCPNVTVLKDLLIQIFDDNDIDEVKFETWLQTDRCTLSTQILKTDDFCELFCEKLVKLKIHDFFAKKQSLFLKNLKENLPEDEFIVTFDFAENYAFVVQNSAQSFHWNNDQATIFTVVIYYRQNNELKHQSIAIISDNLNHDTAAVYEYQKIIINYLKTNFNPKKVYYFTDGAGQHFKNKSSFCNLLSHEKDFGIPAEWHFHATAHGKGSCDGVGAIIKRGAKKASLQCSVKNRIINAQALFEWAKSYCKETIVFFSSKSDYDRTIVELKNRFDNAKTIPGTLQYHAVIPVENKLHLKKNSDATKFDIFPKEKKTKISKK